MKISVVIPLLNEQDNLRPLHQRLVQTLEQAGCQRQIIFVDDGSTDESARVIRELAREDPTVLGLSFSRNFGHEAASTAGFDVAEGQATVLMDADLQDPPELIAEMIKLWQEGWEIVYATRRKREGEGIFKRFTSWLFYRLLNALSDVAIPRDTGDFRLVDARVRQALQQCREKDRFVRGLVAWTGFRATRLFYDRPARQAGKTKYNPFKLLLLSLDAAIGFSTTPLRVTTSLGFVVMLLALFQAARIFVEKLVWGIPVPGFALNATGLFFLGGVQLLMLGILGEYIGRIYRQSQNRPLYLVRQVIGEKDQVHPESARQD